MKKLFILSVIITFTFSQVLAQKAARWELGIQAESGKDWYHRDYYNWNELPNGYVKNFPSYYSRGAGIVTERIFNERFSAIAHISYLQKKMPVEFFDEPSKTHGSWVTKEMHHRGTIDVGMRWYVNPRVKLRVFIDGKLGANMLIATVQQVEAFGKVVDWDAFGYHRINPVASGSIGVKLSRLAISAEYHRDLAPVKRNQTSTGIQGQALVGKVAMTLFNTH